MVVAIGVAAALLAANRGMLERWIGNDVAGIGGPFALTSHTGAPFSRDDLIGRPHILYFGFTFCPDLCPTMLFQLGAIAEELEIGADDLRVVFVSLDPDRDTVPVLREYIGAFHGDFVALTGSAEAIDKAAKAYRIFYRFEPQGDSYTVDHTVNALLFHADGGYAGSIDHQASVDEARAKVVALLEAADGQDR